MKTMILAAAAAATLAIAAPAMAQTYADPDQTTTQAYRSAPRKVCDDPWVTMALIRVYGKAEWFRCSPALYNGGSWTDFNSLVVAVNATKSSFSSAGFDLKGGNLNGAPVVAILQGSTLVAAGGGNLVAAGGGNMQELTNAGLVAAGGGNLQVPSNTPPANLVAAGGGNYTLQSGKSVRLPKGGIRW